MKLNHPLSRQTDIVVQELNGEVLIYDLSANKAFCLNETSALIWELCDGSKSVTEISNALNKKLNTPVNEDLVWLALEQLKKENLIVNSDILTTPFLGMSRREVIKKVGFATIIALPVVTSIVAPTASHAASGGCAGGPVGGTGINTVCTTSCQCNQFGNPPGFIKCCRVFDPAAVPPASNPLICSGSATFNCQTP